MNNKADAKLKKELPGKNEVSAINAALLAGLVAHEYLDIRSFGSALAVAGFNRAITGPIQLGWGYSLNEVFLLDSKTISSIMNDDNSTFGRDFRLRYSLLGFIGTINGHAANYTGLTKDDLQLFRSGLWDGIAALPTRSKLNQYPKLYVEVVYNEGVANGQLGDMRKLIRCRPTGDKEAEQVAGLADLELDFSVLLAAIDDAKAAGAIERVIVRSSFDFPNGLLADLDTEV
jgi:CRISPR-associated protein Csh2